MGADRPRLAPRSFGAAASLAGLAAVAFFLASLLVAIGDGLQQGEASLGALMSPHHLSYESRFERYPNYTGPALRGRVISVSTSRERSSSGGWSGYAWAQTIAFEIFSGGDPSCADGPTNGVDNSCGMHVHNGSSCASDPGPLLYTRLTRPGATSMLYDGDTPWEDVVYRVDPRGKGIGLTRPAMTDLAADRVAGKVVVAHAADGTPIACAQVNESSAHPSEDFLKRFMDGDVVDALIWTQKYMSDEAIARRWDARRAAKPLFVVGDLVTAAAWALAIPAVASYSQILGGADRSASGVLLWAFVVGGLLSATEFMSEAGTATVADWMSDWPMLKALPPSLALSSHGLQQGLSPLQSFEVSFLLSQSGIFWLFAMDNLILAAGLAAAAYLSFTGQRGWLGHARLSAVAALAATAGFGIEVARISSFWIGTSGHTVMRVILYGVMLPVWLMWLSSLLRAVHRSGGAYSPALFPRAQTRPTPTGGDGGTPKRHGVELESVLPNDGDLNT